MKLEAEDLIAELPGASGFQCDLSSDQEIESLFATLKQKFGKLEILVHAVAFAPAAELHGDFLDTSREGFRIALDVSVYSLIAVAHAAAPLMTEGGSIMTLSFYAAEKAVSYTHLQGDQLLPQPPLPAFVSHCDCAVCGHQVFPGGALFAGAALYVQRHLGAGCILLVAPPAPAAGWRSGSSGRTRRTRPSRARRDGGRAGCGRA